jgi:hypothetical protein
MCPAFIDRPVFENWREYLRMIDPCFFWDEIDRVVHPPSTTRPKLSKFLLSVGRLPWHRDH